MIQGYPISSGYGRVAGAVGAAREEARTGRVRIRLHALDLSISVAGSCRLELRVLAEFDRRSLSCEIRRLVLLCKGESNYTMSRGVSTTHHRLLRGV